MLAYLVRHLRHTKTEEPTALGKQKFVNGLLLT